MKYDTDFQAFRRDRLRFLSDMDPYDLVCELDIPTPVLIDRLWDFVELYIEKEYFTEEDLEDMDE